jgi:hypothetical protein
MGKACEFIEKTVGGVALFVNADAGDIDPSTLPLSNCHHTLAHARTHTHCHGLTRSWLCVMCFANQRLNPARRCPTSTVRKSSPAP